MKKYIALFLLISVLWVPGAYAAVIPTQQGLVTDSAGMFSSAEAKSISAAATGDLVTMHVLTVDSLNGTPADKYADETYASWGLSTRDILLLISAGDQSIELNFNNPGFQNSINAWSQNQGGSSGSAAITALLDTYFIPYAREGDFAGGTKALIKAVHSIGDSTGNAGENAGSGSAIGSTDGGLENGTSSNPGTSVSSESRSSSSMFKIAAIVIGTVLILLVLFIVITGLRRRKQLSEQQEQLSNLLVQANRALESLKPFQGIVQGKTEVLVEGISKRLSAKLVEISSLQSDGQGTQPPFYRLNALKAAVEQLQQTEASFRTALEEEEKNIAVISEADRNVKQRITELKEDTPELEEQLHDAVKETGYALQEIVEELKELAEETSKADQLELFDPIAAQEITEDAQERQEKIEQDLKDVDLYDDKLNHFPTVLAASRAKITSIIEQNSLHNMKIKPYDRLEQARVESLTLEAPLRAGDMDEVRRIGANLDLLLDEAVAMTEQQALLRQNNRRDLETFRTEWSQLKQRRDGLQSRITEARIYFEEQHVATVENILTEWSTRLREGASEVAQIENWTSDERGEYDKAHNALEQLLSLLDEAARQFDGVSESLNALHERLDKVTRLFSEGQSRVETTQRMLHSRGLSSRIRFELSLLPEFSALEHRLTSRPYNLEELESLSRSYDSQITSFVNEANRLVRQKEEEERLAQLAMMREQQRRAQARKRMSSGPPSSGGFGGGRSSGGSSWGGGGGGGKSSGGSSWGGGGGKSGRNSSGGSKW
ncbi:septation ring formation regulator EzrA [Paenibacillus sp. FSL E2-0201]|uniref:septation ring formation regulator EzrA n=1 Tax=Paenibacillus sp. FSL E2-0201 TaxID=2954726 RepID=UPI0030DC61FC